MKLFFLAIEVTMLFAIVMILFIPVIILLCLELIASYLGGVEFSIVEKSIKLLQRWRDSIEQRINKLKHNL
jgi:hypothetical protein